MTLGQYPTVVAAAFYRARLQSHYNGPREPSEVDAKEGMLAFAGICQRVHCGGGYAR